MTALDVDFDDGPPVAPSRAGQNRHAPEESFETALPARPAEREVMDHGAERAPPEAAGRDDRRAGLNVVAPRAAALGCTLPSSPEAEAHLLGSIFVDPADVLPRARDAHVTHASFLDPQNAAMMRAILKLDDARQPVDQATVAEELKGAPEFTGRNIFAKLVEVTSGVGTTAQASYFIEKVREQALLRHLIYAATRTVEECYNFTGGIEEFAAETVGRLVAVANGAEVTSDLEQRQFNPKALVKRPTPIFSLSGIPIMTPGNISTIYAMAKAGKTALEAAMIAAAMTTPDSQHDTLGVTGPNYDKGAVLHFDTEQSKHDWQQKTVLSALRRVGVQDPPPWLLSYHLTGMDARKAREFVQRALRAARKKFGRIHSVFIDGVADLVASPNNEEESYELVRMLHAAAIEYDTAIACILHLNPASKDKIDKGRGHLGSQLERKSESNLTLKKDGDVTTVLGEGRQRNGPIPPDKSPSFRWSDEHQMHRSCPTPNEDGTSRAGRGRKESYTFNEMKSCFPAKNEQPKRLKELFRTVTQTVPIKSESQFYNVLQRFASDGFIEVVEVTGGRGYRLAL